MFNTISNSLVFFTLLTMNSTATGQMAYGIRPYAYLYRNNYSVTDCSVSPKPLLISTTNCNNLTMNGTYSQCCHNVLSTYNNSSNFDVCYPTKTINDSFINDGDGDGDGYGYGEHNYNSSVSSYLYSCSITYDEIEYMTAEGMVIVGAISLTFLGLAIVYYLLKCLCCRRNEYREL